MAIKRLSVIRYYKDEILNRKYKNILPDVFVDKDRIYIDFEGDNINKCQYNEIVSKTIKDLGYMIIDYRKGLAVNTNNENGNKIRIGKILKDNHEVLKIYQQDKTRTAAKKTGLKIVISRHPYDIIGMSTGRGWTSCMLLDNEYPDPMKEVMCDVRGGTMIAYIVSNDDKNIEHPMSRLLLKPYTNVCDKEDIIYGPDYDIYGAPIIGFRERLLEWLSEIQEIKGTYMANEDVFFSDIRTPTYIGKGIKDSDVVEIRILYYTANPKDIDAKTDEDRYIREMYYKNNKHDKDMKFDMDPLNRCLYYNIHPEDLDAKTDKDWGVRRKYYMLHKNDPSAKFDEDWYIKNIYYDSHPNDFDFEKDEDGMVNSRIR